jgi:oligopeptide transport system substrate-binding protein
MGSEENRWVPIIAVVLFLCLCGTCLIGLVGGSYFLTSGQQVSILPTRPPASPAPTTPREVPPPSPVPFEKGGPGTQTLRLPGAGEGGDPPTLDPALSGDTTSAAYVVEIFSGLTTFNQNVELIPDLAESWDISSNGTTYTFYLRRDARFQDGKPVRAQDFQYSFERACDPSTGSTRAETYLGDIVGCQDKLEGRAKEVAGIKVLDDHTLQLTIDAPKAYFLSKLSYTTAFVVDKENVERGGRTWTEHPNGTGPFKLAEYRPGELIVLERNENYYRDPHPTLEKVYFSLLGGDPMTLYEQGELDSAQVFISDVERVTDPTNSLNKELSITPQMSISYIGFNLYQPPFDDVNVRKAFNYAINTKKLAEVTLKKMVEPANGIVPPTVPGYKNPGLEGYDYDPDKARSLITESKYKDVSAFPTITWYTVGTGGSPGLSIQAITAMLKDNLGVQIDIQQTDWATFLAELDSPQNPYQMYDLGWVADYPDPQNFLDVLFHSDSNENHMGYSNPQVDKLLDEARSEQDQAKRLKLYQEAEQMIINDAPWVPLNYGVDYWLTKPYVKGLINPPLVIPRLQYVSIAAH